jgi:hypothetical protein
VIPSGFLVLAKALPRIAVAGAVAAAAALSLELLWPH